MGDEAVILLVSVTEEDGVLDLAADLAAGPGVVPKGYQGMQQRHLGDQGRQQRIRLRDMDHCVQQL